MVLGQHAERVASLEATTYAYAIRAALRRCGLFLKATSSSKAIGLALPPDADSDAYSEAAKAILRQTETLKHYAVTSVFLGRRGDSHVEKAHSVLEERSAVVVLIEHGAALPAAVAVALDRIVEVGPVKAIHLMSAAKSAWQTEILKEAAQELCGYPPELLFRALRDGRPIDIVLEKLAAASKAPATTAWEPRVEELEGYGEARDWAADLVVDLADWGAGTLAWRDVDAGLLLSGPPGTGKTLFASALARSCGAKFIGTSSAQWQSKGHLGDMLGAMRKSFREAADAAPSVLFIDEFDSIGDRRTFRGDNASYSLQVVNALLELLDGSTGREGVIVIAASNFPDHIDPALRRPGRLDRHVAIDLPDQEARQQMLSMHLGTADAPEDLLKAALATSGYSGADLAQVAKDARRVARRQGREARVSDVLAIVPPVAPIGKDEHWSASVHEAGHALIGIELSVAEIEMIVVAKEAGHRDGSIGHVQWRRQNKPNRTRQSYLDEIAMLLGGMAAEKVVLGDIFDGSGGVAGSDLQRASDLATVMLASLGLGSLQYCDVSTSKELDELRRSDPILRRRVERLLEAELLRAATIIEGRKPEVEKLARAVAKCGAVWGCEVVEIVSGQKKAG
ncbi:ATPase [Sinorhizobium meliloti]|uniref:AAA family ATPase n=1 Tax=Rhizobium meliloti TaxID=382 RepID=UPI000B4A2076|nr:AAA family ATPase [Sinorhizobium meliloti]ASP70533.1 ATPase [Sinorhizobium meliloti]MDE3854989.1 AAA family ATPase [Sinorhizobium meliloti]MQW52962.1 AAA family ATPase [Sinorhizobium meliloti]